jgi:hypothetical protein
LRFDAKIRVFVSGIQFCCERIGGRYGPLLLCLWLFVGPSTSIAGQASEDARSPLSCAGIWDWRASPDTVPSWGGYKPKLEAMGISPFIQFAGDFLGNVSGGKRRGFAYTGMLGFGLSLDLRKLFGLQGLTFTISGNYSSGRDLSKDDIGNALTVSQAVGLTTFFGAGRWFWAGRLPSTSSLVNCLT